MTETKLPEDNDNGIGTEPLSWTPDDLYEVLKEAYRRGVSDILVMTGSPIAFKKSGQWSPVTKRSLRKSETEILLDGIRMGGSSAELRAREDLDFAIGVKMDRGQRIRFRVNATGILSDGAEGISIVFRTLPSVPKKLSEMGVQKDITDNIFPHVGLALVVGATGCHAAGTKILMSDGSSKNVEEIMVGDTVMGPDLQPRTVVRLHRGAARMVQIQPRKGTPFVVNDGHILSLYEPKDLMANLFHGRKIQELGPKAISVKDYENLPDKDKRKKRLWKTGFEGVNRVSLLKFSIKEAGFDKYYGFELDGDHLYLTNDFIVHHNSGKTTLLAGVIRSLLEDHKGKHILTYESPIEFVYDDIPDKKGFIAQSEIPTNIPTFARAVRNSLRRAPHIILVGESRDPETIMGSVTACQTGHAVYSTVHVNSVSQTIARMVGEFPAAERNSVAAKILDALQIVVHQRLIPKPGFTGVVAVREWLVFDRTIRQKLALLPWEEWAGIINAEMERRKQTLLSDVEEKIKNGLLERETAMAYIADTLSEHEKNETKTD